jgi:hypothetical protein
MKKNQADDPQMKEHYSFKGGVRGKHYEAYSQGTNVVLLEPDVAKVFRDSDAVNRALRELIATGKASA